MSNRKQDIIDTAVRLFNEHGFYNVSLKEIARELAISPGNLTYHFRRKDDLLMAIQEQLIEDASMPMMPDALPGFVHLQALQEAYHQNQIKYAFYFNNLLYIFRAYPEIAARYRKVTEERLSQGRMLLEHYVDQDLLRVERNKGDYDSLIRVLWMTSVFWTGSDAVLEGVQLEAARNNQKEVFWSLIRPHLTEKGLDAYNSLARNKPTISQF